MRQLRLAGHAALVAALALWAACAEGSGKGQGDGTHQVSSSGDAGSGGSSSGSGGSSSGSGGSSSGSGGSSSGIGGSIGGSGGSIGGSGGSIGGSGGATGMDPQLDLPNPSGQACNAIGFSSDCPSLQVCRISGPNAGTCESCTSCNNLGASCSQSSDCDILFQCYQSVCTNICPLGTSYCGPPQDCLDVGHATHGVCKP